MQIHSLKPQLKSPNTPSTRLTFGYMPRIDPGGNHYVRPQEPGFSQEHVWAGLCALVTTLSGICAAWAWDNPDVRYAISTYNNEARHKNGYRNDTPDLAPQPSYAGDPKNIQTDNANLVGFLRTTLVKKLDPQIASSKSLAEFLQDESRWNAFHIPSVRDPRYRGGKAPFWNVSINDFDKTVIHKYIIPAVESRFGKESPEAQTIKTTAQDVIAEWKSLGRNSEVGALTVACVFLGCVTAAAGLANVGQILQRKEDYEKELPLFEAYVNTREEQE